MHEQHEVEEKLKVVANDLSAKHGGAPVVIILGGSESANIRRTMTASSFKKGQGRLRDLLGLLQTSIQIETLKHFQTPPFSGDKREKA